MAHKHFHRIDRLAAKGEQDGKLVFRKRSDTIGKADSSFTPPFRRRSVFWSDTGDALCRTIAQHEPCMLIDDCDAIAHAVQDELQHVSLALGRRNIRFLLAIRTRRCQVAHAALAAQGGIFSIENCLADQWSMGSLGGI